MGQSAMVALFHLCHTVFPMCISMVVHITLKQHIKKRTQKVAKGLSISVTFVYLFKRNGLYQQAYCSQNIISKLKDFQKL